MNNARILVLIPCYQCAPQIGRVLRQFRDVPDGVFEEILVLDNGSRDGTADAALAAADQITCCPVTIARNRENYNLGGSHKAAFSYASAKGFTHVVVLHGDDQGSIQDLLPHLAQGQHLQFDACLGARFMPGSVLTGYSAFRRFGNHVFNLLFSAVSGRRIFDLGSGLNIFSSSIFQDASVRLHADDLRFNVYLLLDCVDKNRKLMFFPIGWREEDQVSNVRMFSQARKTLAIAVEYVFDRRAFRQRDHRQVAHGDYVFDALQLAPGEARA
ncbi:MAG: glycosyltransferase family 2 protein [Proteobacteria bacterium]|nr:glycosyltransferase family 2 protein [Pseudomonadota bacterium]